MSKRTLALIVILTLITLSLVYIAVTPKETTVNQPQLPLSSLPTPTPAAQSRLYLSPSTIEMSTNSNAVDVNIDTGGNSVTAIQLEISYDPSILTNVDIAGPTANGFLDNPVQLIKNIDKQKGMITFAVGISPTAPAKKGMGTVGRITFQSFAKTGQTVITITPKSLVTAEGVTQSVLKETNGATILFETTQGAAGGQAVPPVQPVTSVSPSLP